MINKLRQVISDPSKRLISSFTSFLGDDGEPLQDENLFPILLPGETVISEANKVLLFTPVSDQKSGQSGALFVTNFKLSFVTSEGRDRELNCQTNNFLGYNDVCLSNVDIIYQVSGDKKKRLQPGQNVMGRVKGLFIVCKNMRSLSFSFKFSPPGHGKTFTNSLLHHAFPSRHPLLFAYDFTEPYTKYVKEVSFFRGADDWNRELVRTQCKGWRLTTVNHNFQISPSLPQWIVVSSTVLDWQLIQAARHYVNGRPPVWCWSTSSGAALVRSADIIATITDRVQENIMLETVRKAHPKLTQPVLIDLTKDIPSPKDLETSFIKLRELCTPDSVSQFWEQDTIFFTLLEQSKWLTFVHQCLDKSLDAAQRLEKDVTIVLQESDGRDMCCVISSLIQILLDPYFRTITGFQSLIQKEWIMMGHPFCTRLGHVYNVESQKSPLLLLFLDCVWQLLQQFPSHFQFTETYLTTMWDSAHLSIFDSFLFDCDKDRLVAAAECNTHLTLRSLWDWGEQFSDKDRALFFNPLYNASQTTSLTSDTRVSICHLQPWAQCYYRFLPQLELVGGGNPQIDFIYRTVLKQSSERLEDMACEKVGSFYPFTQWRQHTGSAPPTSLLLSTLSLNTSCDDTLSFLDDSNVTEDRINQNPQPEC